MTKKFFYDNHDKLIMDIKENPKEYIGKESLKRLDSFLDGFRIGRAVFDNELKYQDSIINGFQWWLSKKFNDNSNNKWPKMIEYYSTDENDAFYKFYDYLKEYTDVIDQDMKKIKFLAGVHLKNFHPNGDFTIGRPYYDKPSDNKDILYAVRVIYKKGDFKKAGYVYTNNNLDKVYGDLNSEVQQVDFQFNTKEMLKKLFYIDGIDIDIDEYKNIIDDVTGKKVKKYSKFSVDICFKEFYTTEEDFKKGCEEILDYMDDMDKGLSGDYNIHYTFHSNEYKFFYKCDKEKNAIEINSSTIDKNANKNKGIDDINSLLKTIKFKPLFFLNKECIIELAALIDGFIFAQSVTDENYESNIFYPGFNSWVSDKFRIKHGVRWGDIINFFSSDEKEAFHKFFELLETYNNQLEF